MMRDDDETNKEMHRNNEEDVEQFLYTEKLNRLWLLLVKKAQKNDNNNNDNNGLRNEKLYVEGE